MGDFVDVFPVYPEQQALLIEPLSVAYRTFDGFRYVVHHPFECHHFGIGPASYPEQFIGPVYQQRQGILGYLVNRVEQGKTVFLGNGPDDIEFFVFPGFSERDYPSVGN